MSLVASSVSHAFPRDLAAVSDRELVATAVSGVEGSFEELVRRYQRPIAAYVSRMVGNYESALDLTQEIFIKVYSSLRRYREEFKFSTWIYKIAHNSAVDHLRRNATREQSLVMGPEGERWLGTAAATVGKLGNNCDGFALVTASASTAPPPTSSR